MNLCLDLALNWRGKRSFTPPTNTPIAFQSLTANGTSGTVSTTQLTATFDIDPGLNTSNFVVTGASKGVVSKVGAVYTVNIHTITVEDGQGVTLDIINVPSGFTITPLFRTVAVNVAPASSLFPTPSYTQAWMSEIVTRPQDNDGWTILSISATSRVMYVSESGDDGAATPYIYGDGSAFTDWFADEGQVAYRTHQAAIAQMREGENDVVLLRYGDSFEQTGEINNLPAGKSLLESHIITAYGNPALGRPFIAFKKQGSNSTMFDNVTQVGQVGRGDNFIIAHIHASCTVRDPSSPDFAGWNNVAAASFYFSYSNAPTMYNTLIEGCRMDWFSVSINTSSVVENFHERRNTFYRNYGNFAVGSYGQKTRYLQQENLFYHCGYYDRYDGTDNTFAYSGQFVDELATTLSGAAETQVVFTRTLPSNMPDGVYIYVTTDGAVEVEIEVLSYTGSTITIPATDFSADNATAGNQVRVRLYGGVFTSHSSYALQPKKYYCVDNVSINPSSTHNKNINDDDDLLNAYDCAYTGNLYVGGEIGIEARGNVSSTSLPRFGRFIVGDNVFAGVGQNKPTNRGLSWPMWFQDHEDLDAQYNWVSTIFTDAVVDDRRTVLLGGLFTDSDVKYNIFEGTESTIQESGITAGQSIAVYGNAINETGYVEATRDIDSYMTEFHSGGTTDDFAALLLPRHKGNWITLDRDAHSYIKEGFRFTDKGINIIDQAENQLAREGDDAVFSINAYIEPIDAYQWYNSPANTPVSGATSRLLTLSAVSLADNGDQYYPIVSSNKGSVTGTAATLTVEEAIPYVTFNGVDSYASISPDMIVRDGVTGIGDWVQFEVKTTTGGIVVGESGSADARVEVNATGVIVRTWISPTTFNYPKTGLLDGNWHTIKIERDAADSFFAVIDGETIAQSGTTSITANIRVNRVARRGTIYTNASVRNLTVSGSVLTTYAIDSGSTTTEAASVGTGTMTFVNVISGDWT